MYQDDDNYIEISCLYNNGPFVGIRVEEAGTPATTYVPVTADTIQLHIVKEGDAYLGWFSEENGMTWGYIGQYSIPMSNPKVGLSAKLGPTTTPVTTNWDYVRVESYADRIFLPFVVK